MAMGALAAATSSFYPLPRPAVLVRPSGLTADQSLKRTAADIVSLSGQQPDLLNWGFRDGRQKAYRFYRF